MDVVSDEIAFCSVQSLVPICCLYKQSQTDNGNSFIIIQTKKKTVPMSLRLNPEYDKLLPKMSEEEFAELKISIQTEGQHYPIIVNEDLEVLDGHHRFRACLELGVEPDFDWQTRDQIQHAHHFPCQRCMTPGALLSSWPSGPAF